MPIFGAPRLSTRFSDTADPGTDGELTREVREDATVETVTVRFYQGPELDLELWPFVETDGGRRLGLVELVGRSTIVGDNDHVEFSVSEPVEDGQTIGVEFENQSVDYAYDFNIDIELDRAGGLGRVSGAIDRLREAI